MRYSLAFGSYLLLIWFETASIFQMVYVILLTLEGPVMFTTGVYPEGNDND